MSPRYRTLAHMGSSEVTSTTAVVPTWVSCDRRQIQDFHQQAYQVAARTRAPHVIGMLDAIDWIVGCEPIAPVSGQRGEVTEQFAGEELNRAVAARRAETSASGWAGGVADALAYFVGLASAPPLEVPRRNPDGTLVTAEQLYQTFLDSRSGPPTPEQRDKARHEAEVTALRWSRLAS